MTIPNGQHSGIVGTTHYNNSDGTLPFNGGNSAYYCQAYLACPFNLDIGGMSCGELWQEEEFAWRDRLAMFGSVVSVDARYSEIDPLPLMSAMKRAFGFKNNFSGGDDRSSMNIDNNATIAFKVCVIGLSSLMLSIFLNVT